jgi:hypothetical protein
MKKWLTVACVIFIILIAGIYIFIPSILVVSKTELIQCNVNAAFRSIGEEANWQKWWRAGEESGYSHRISEKFYHEVEIPLEKGGLRIISRVNVLPLNNMDSVLLHWRGSFKTSLNPVKRIQQYRQAVIIAHTMTGVLSNLRNFLEKKENIYGIDPRDTMSKDSTLVAAKLVTTSYPGTTELYHLIKTIRDYIASQGANEIDYPMLNIKKIRDDQFEIMVAIPTDRNLKGNDKLFPRHFVPLKILVADVKGGPCTVDRALDQMQQYVEDYQRTVMAIPFQLLVTERNQEADTSRWVTRLAQPIF